LPKLREIKEKVLKFRKYRPDHYFNEELVSSTATPSACTSTIRKRSSKAQQRDTPPVFGLTSPIRPISNALGRKGKLKQRGIKKAAEAQIRESFKKIVEENS